MKAPTPIKIPGLETYYGGKGGEGVYQTIINHFPPHKRYVEGCLGAGWIMRYKAPARVENIGLDLDSRVIDFWRKARPGRAYYFHEINVMEWLKFNAESVGPETLIYLDPPYPLSSRRQAVQTYLFEMTDDDHVSLLKAVLQLKCRVAISTCDNALYCDLLKGWNKVHFQGWTRRGPATETLYMNYDLAEIGELHDYRFLGSDYRERERIRRKLRRAVEGLRRLPIFERKAILTTINEQNQ
jgi:DNA adenine methylase